MKERQAGGVRDKDRLNLSAREQPDVVRAMGVLKKEESGMQSCSQLRVKYYRIFFLIALDRSSSMYSSKVRAHPSRQANT